MTVYIFDDPVTFPDGDRGEWLPLANCHLGQGDINHLAVPNLVINSVIGSFPE